MAQQAVHGEAVAPPWFPRQLEARQQLGGAGVEIQVAVIYQG